MKRFDVQDMDVSEEMSFLYIPTSQYDNVISELNEALNNKMRKNDIQEAKSIEFAAKFVTTV